MRVTSKHAGRRPDRSKLDSAVRSTVAAIESLEARQLLSAFTPGDLAIYRVGNGTETLASTGDTVWIDEYTTSGALVQSIAMPNVAAGSGSNQPLIASGTATSEGLLATSADGHSLVTSGYDAVTGGSTVLTSSASSSINRTVGVIAADGTINTKNAYSDWSTANNPRSVASQDGTSFYLAGGAGGIRYATAGGTTAQTSTQIQTLANNRLVSIQSGQLYASDSSTSGGNTAAVYSIGSGLPTSTGQTQTQIVSLTAAPSAYAFYFADLSASVSGVDTLYVADDTSSTGGIRKFSLVSGTWTSNGVIGAGSLVRGLAGSTSGSTVTLYATTGGSNSAGGGTLFGVTDTAGYNATPSTSTLTTIATAATSEAFRGVAFVPTATLSAGPSVTGVSPNSGTTAGGNTVTINGSGFTAASAVSFGGTPAASFTVLGDTQISAVVPTHSGATVDVRVTTASGTSAIVAADQYTFAVAPMISGISQTAPAPAGVAFDGGGTVIIINGSGFINGSTTVTIGGNTSPTVTFVSSSQIKAVAPGHADGTVDVTVTTVGGSATAVGALTYAGNIAAAETLPSGTTFTLSDNPVVTAILDHLTPNYTFLIDDGSGSLDVFRDSTTTTGYTPTVGDAITVSGKWSPFNQIQEMGTITAITRNSQGNSIPAPLVRTIPQATVNPLPIGTDIATHMVTIQGVAIGGLGSGTFGTANKTGSITDTNGHSMTLFYNPASYTVSQDNLSTQTVPNALVDVTGIEQVFGGVPELIPFSFTASSNTEPVDQYNASGGTNIDGGGTNEVLNTDGSITITVTRTASDSNYSATETVDYTTADGTGTAGTDYTTTSGTLTFDSTHTSGTFTVPVQARPAAAGAHTFVVNLTPHSAPSRVAVASPYTVKILDPRPIPVNIAGAEGQPSGQNITLNSNPVVTKILSVPGTTNGVTYTNWSFLVNDGTGSMDIFGALPGGYTPTLGDKLSITGTFSPFDQIPEINPVSSISLISSGNPLPGSDPLAETISDVNKSTLPNSIAGHLITLNGVTISGEGSSFGTSNSPSGAMITDSGGKSMTLFYWPTSYSKANEFFNGTSVPLTPVNLTGIVDVFSGTAEFIPIFEPGVTFDRLSMSNNLAPSVDPDGFQSVARNSSVTVTVTRNEVTDNASIKYTIIPDSAAAGADYTYNSGTNVTGTLSLPIGTTSGTFTITTLPTSSSGDKLFTIQLSNATSDGSGIVPSVTNALQSIVITDPSAHHTISNNSFGENATVQLTGPRHSTGTTDSGITLFQAEADNATNDPTLQTPPGTGTQFESYGVLTYNDWDGTSGDPSHLFSLGGNTIGSINSIEIEGVAAPQSFAHDGQLDVYLTFDTTTNIAFDATTPITYDKTSLPQGVGSTFGTKYLLGTINYSASQAGGVYTPFNLNIGSANPTALSMLATALNNSTPSNAHPFRIIVATHDDQASLSWQGSTSGIIPGVNGGAATDVSPILRISYSAPSTFPAWLDPTSVATWAAPNLNVTGVAKIIADPGTDEPIVTVAGSGSLEIHAADTAHGGLVHLGGLTDNGLVTVDSVSTRTHDNHIAIVIGTLGGGTPPFSVSGKFDLGDNDLVVHHGNLADVQALLARGRNTSPSFGLDGTWDGNGLTSSAAQAADASDGLETHVLGVALNDDDHLLNGHYDSWTVNGQTETLDTSDVLVKYTYNADMTLDGVVDGNDDGVFGFFYDNGTTSGHGFSEGDLNGDGKVDGTDDGVFGFMYDPSRTAL